MPGTEIAITLRQSREGLGSFAGTSLRSARSALQVRFRPLAKSNVCRRGPGTDCTAALCQCASVPVSRAVLHYASALRSCYAVCGTDLGLLLARPLLPWRLPYTR
eukprot:1378539-Rhodomonas_salina.1